MNSAKKGGRYVLANFLVAADGSTSVHGRSVGLSSRQDRMKFHELRSTADAIVIGGNTARCEPYSTTPVPLFVLTRSNLPDEISSNSLARAVNTRLEDLLNVLEGNILIEAGPSLLAEALREKLVDELHLTITALQPQENQISLEKLVSGYQEISREEIENESFLILTPKR